MSAASKICLSCWKRNLQKYQIKNMQCFFLLISYLINKIFVKSSLFFYTTVKYLMNWNLKSTFLKSIHFKWGVESLELIRRNIWFLRVSLICSHLESGVQLWIFLPDFDMTAYFGFATAFNLALSWINHYIIISQRFNIFFLHH